MVHSTIIILCFHIICRNSINHTHYQNVATLVLANNMQRGTSYKFLDCHCHHRGSLASDGDYIADRMIKKMIYHLFINIYI